ncbi:MAG: hypothetical protein EPN91_11320 [Salinibacterium sp.]|nr:MAG: hypothetical protein EPN91_11320 [Salinibacterium sp.]
MPDLQPIDEDLVEYLKTETEYGLPLRMIVNGFAHPLRLWLSREEFTSVLQERLDALVVEGQIEIVYVDRFQQIPRYRLKAQVEPDPAFGAARSPSA